MHKLEHIILLLQVGLNHITFLESKFFVLVENHSAFVALVNDGDCLLEVAQTAEG